MLEFTLIVVVVLVGLALLGRNEQRKIILKNSTINKTSTNAQVDSYKLYSNWCKRTKQLPIDKLDFEQLANSEGSIDLADLINVHDKKNPAKMEKETNDTYDDGQKELDERLQNDTGQKKAQKKAQDKKFTNSVLAGYLTDSAAKGTLMGGNLSGGLLGAFLKDKSEK